MIELPPELMEAQGKVEISFNHYWQHDATSLGKTKRISYELNRTSLTLTWGEEGGLTLQESCKILGPPKI